MIYMIIAIALFVVLGHFLAKSKGLNPVFWGLMGGLFGPLMLIAILFAKPGHTGQPSS